MWPKGRHAVKQIIYLGACLVLVACGDPLANVDRLDDVVLADSSDGSPAPTTAQVAAQPEELARKPGLLGLLRRDPKPDPAPAPAASAVDAAVADVVTPDSAAEAPAPDQSAAETAAASEPAAPAPRRGLLGRLLGGGSGTEPAKPVAETADSTTAAAPQDTVLASAPQAAPPVTSDTPGPRRGLFAARTRTPRIDPNAPDARVVTYGVAVPFGQIVRVCDVPRGSYGKEIGRYPERRPEYRLYDSKPSQTGLRTHYITGFKDGCARQFTAALALFGEPVLHEQLRYGLPSKVQPYSRTDEAYEKVKSRVCRVPKGKSCGARIDKLAKDTVFVSTYERFVGSASWANILLHAGEVVEKDQLQR